MSDAALVPASSPALHVDLVEIAAELVGAYVTRNSVAVADMPGLIAIVHRTLVDLGRSAPGTSAPDAKPTPPVSVRKSMGDDYLVSMEDGKRYKALKRHLTKLGLTPAEYRAKWGLPADYPMVAPASPMPGSAATWPRASAWARCAGSVDPTAAIALRASGRSGARRRPAQ